MTWTIDPMNEWTNAWEVKNPEPELIFYPCIDGKDRAHWGDIFLHIEWHQRRWEDFKKAFKLPELHAGLQPINRSLSVKIVASKSAELEV